MAASLRDLIVDREPPSWRIDGDRIHLDSPAWKGSPWTHEILIAEPFGGRTGRSAILEITGDNVSDEDLAWAQEVADESGFPVFVLCQVPNQPLWGLREDHLIAHTFVKFLETGESEWPLLVPMTRSAVLALDAIQDWSGGIITQFVVTGASKRGWTSWLLGSLGDPRIAGIAPRIFDNLHFLRQIEKQLRQWGAFSTEVDPYVERGLPHQFSTPKGLDLLRLVDPWHSLDRVKIPILLMHGAFDPFWTIDALSEYWEDIASPKWCFVAMAGHTLWPIKTWGPLLGAFAEACFNDIQLPQVSGAVSRVSDDDYSFKVADIPKGGHAAMICLSSVQPHRFTADGGRSTIPLSESGECIISREVTADIAVVPQIAFEFLGRDIILALPPTVISQK